MVMFVEETVAFNTSEIKTNMLCGLRCAAMVFDNIEKFYMVRTWPFVPCLQTKF